MKALENKTNVLAFEQQPKESNKAFEAFSLYLTLGANRSLAAVAQKLDKSHTLIARWSTKFDWTARVRAHGAHLALIERESIEALERVKSIEWAKVHEDQKISEWKARCELLELAREAIQRWRDNPKRCGTLEGIGRLLELASKLGRLASGMPTDVKEVKGEFSGTLDVDWEIAIRKAYGGKAEGENRKAETVVDVEEIPAKELKP
jgi:hypothetical protein